MFSIDIRTIYLSVTIVNIINLILISSLYIQIKRRFPGTLLLLVSFILSATGNILILLRNVIPDWLSIPVANLFIVSACLLLLHGFEQFVKKRGYQIQNYILLLVFFLVHIYFTFEKPDLHVRTINFATAYVLFSFQIAFLMLKRTPLSMRKITRPVGLVFFVVCAIQIFHVFYLIQVRFSRTNIFDSNLPESLIFLSWEIIIILVGYSIALMYNTRLIIDVNAQEEKFSKAFHAAPFIIMLSKYSDGEIFEVNNSVESFSGYHPNELIGFKSSDLHIWEHDEDRNKFIADLNLKGVVIENEYVYRKKSGELFPGLMTAEIITINNEKCIISVIQDITNRKQTELNLRNSETRLREINATKDKFFSIIAHDLRSPLNGIIGFSELLRTQVKEKDCEGIEQYAEIINSSSHQALDLLSNLMEWAQSQTGSIVYNPDDIDIVSLIESTVELLKTSSEQKGISIKVNTPLHLILHADKAMIEVVLRNFISNAIKFTAHQGIVLISAEEKENNFLISIADSGVGINSNSIEKLFKIDSSYSTLGTDNEAGTGLGLILCKDFIDYHKGKIWVESELGVGSTFYFSIPKKI